MEADSASQCVSPNLQLDDLGATYHFRFLNYTKASNGTQKII